MQLELQVCLFGCVQMFLLSGRPVFKTGQFKHSLKPDPFNTRPNAVEGSLGERAGFHERAQMGL